MYADDIVLFAKNRKVLQDMIGSFRRFLEEKKLELCTEKLRYWYVIREEEKKYGNGVKKR